LNCITSVTKNNHYPILGGFTLRYSTLSFLTFLFNLSVRVFCETCGYHSGVAEVLVSLDMRLCLWAVVAQGHFLTSRNI